MKKIPLTQGKFALVDDEDFDFLNQRKWCAHKYKSGYRVMRKEGSRKKQVVIYMHRILLNPKKNQQIDHANRNGLDNRRTNLRICTAEQNNWNHGLRKNNTNGYIGIVKKPLAGGRENYQARIWSKSRCICLGTFDTIIKACEAYNKAAKKLRGEFAVFNTT